MQNFISTLIAKATILAGVAVLIWAFSGLISVLAGGVGIYILAAIVMLYF